jgi:hypothetical protein
MAYRQIQLCNTINCDPEQWLKKAHPNTAVWIVMMDVDTPKIVPELNISYTARHTTAKILLLSAPYHG